MPIVVQTATTKVKWNLSIKNKRKLQQAIVGKAIS